MEIAPASIEVCLKLNRFVCGEAENDVVALRDSHVRILSSHELGTLLTVPFSEGDPVPLSLPPSRPLTQRDLPKSNLSSRSGTKERPKEKELEPQRLSDPNAVIIDSTTEERPKRSSSKFLKMLNEERKSRWNCDQAALPVDGVESHGADNSTRLNKGMHSPPKFEPSSSLNPLRQEQKVSQQLRDEMFMDILAQQRNQNFADNMSQVSGMSAKERILKTGHATGIPDNLRQL
ncbi:hypothetical protein BOX15_Mlig016723g3 [Macrostomum lignano]|uniref:Uncharacterized protein n=1 Tax=Macrostomum lignano TaxID=282301 RepID=A0A267H3K8_9PLAT|nr:hypothetical protein BOX15_Mlig016723g3 [Macrostomum lignano]